MASAQNHQNDEVEGFWLFDGLDEEPYGLLPLANLSGKSGASSTKNIPGMPLESFYWPGGKLRQDHGVVIYNVNHMKVKDGQLDSAILAAKLCSANNKKKTEINFDDYDIITDAINLQKLFAFGQEAGDGLFRIDCERVGKTVLLSRMEASDLMEIGHLTYDQSMKAKMTKTRSKHCSGPFFQLTSYQFGTLKILVRYEVECADFAGAKAEIFEDIDQLPEKTEFAENKAISYINFGNIPDNLPLQLLTTYPHGGGFPFFTWAQMFFTCADQEMIGFWKGNGDFSKPAIYSRKADGAISKSVRKFLSTQCKNRTEEEIQEIAKKQKG
uniref:COesterase domain-containing protein n=1 Tax=Meloidogyne hapla TaxID=6305 RepID=A0A1I8B7X1_MELHA